MDTDIALDVWLKFSEENDEESEYEANTFKTEDGYRVDWYHTAVGQIMSMDFDSYEDAASWLEEEGFIDFTS